MFEFILGKNAFNIQQFQTQFNEFIVENRLVGTAAGVTIGVTTKDLIQSLVGDVIIPFFYIFAFQFGIEKIELLPGKTTFDFTTFIRQFITWILSVVAIFFFIYYFFMSITGINQEPAPTPPTPPIQSIAPTTPNSNISTAITKNIHNINSINKTNGNTIASYNYNSNNTNAYNNVNTDIQF